MSRKTIHIKIVMHKPKNAETIFESEQIKTFWMEKIASKMGACTVFIEDQKHGIPFG